MQPMKVHPLYDALVGASIVDADTQPVLPLAIAAAHQELGLRFALDAATEIEVPLDDSEKRLLMECCLVLIAHNFCGKRADALAVQVRLIAENPDFEWRPAPPESDPVEESPEDSDDAV